MPEPPSPDTDAYFSRDAYARQILEDLERRDAAPFRRHLAKILRNADLVSDEALQRQGERDISRLAQAAAILARLSGYTEKIEIEATGLLAFAQRLQRMSDAELARLDAAELVDHHLALPAPSSPPTPPPADSSDSSP